MLHYVITNNQQPTTNNQQTITIMTLPPSFSTDEASAKLSININAFNGNTTNFNRPRPKNVNAPVQPPTFLPSRPLIPTMTPM